MVNNIINLNLSMRLLFSSTFILFTILSFCQTNIDKSLARVQKVSGKYVFLNCEPLNEYEVIYEVKAVPLSTSSVSSTDKISNFVLNKALKMKKKQGKDFDALIIGTSKFDLAIKFIE